MAPAHERYDHEKYDDIKRKLRKLKKLEMKIRFPGINFQESNQMRIINSWKVRLVWDDFFDLHEGSKKNVKYPINRLVSMNKNELRVVINEYFYNVYYRYYRENGMTDMQLYNPDILTEMGLPMDADSHEIKKKFRELAKKYHPDTGGDSEKFIELMEKYRSLFKKDK